MLTRSKARLTTHILRRLLAATQWLDQRDPRWLAWLSPQRKRRWMSRLWRPMTRLLPDTHSVDGLQLRVPPAMRRIAVLQDYEPSTRRLLATLLRPGDRVVDVGANIGLLTTWMARAVGAEGHVWAVEPDADNLALLAENLALNGLSERVTIIAAAAGERREHRRLYRRTSGAQHSLHGKPGDGAPAVDVPCVPVGEVVQGTVHLIKIDVEGAELEALRGMMQILTSDSPPQLIIEWCPQSAERAGEAPTALPQFLADQGYRLSLVPECPGPDDIADALDRVAAGQFLDGWYCNLHATPEEAD